MDNVLLNVLTRIEGKLDRVIAGPESPTVGLKEAMRLTGDRSSRAFYRTAARLGFLPLARGKYRRLDILNALGRAALLAQRQHKTDAFHEIKTEAQRKVSKPNPQDD